MVRDLLAAVRRAEATASSLSRAHRVNVALYAFALMGLGLIALELRQADTSPREVRSLPSLATTTTVGRVVAPGDRRPVEPSAADPSPAPEPVSTASEPGSATAGDVGDASTSTAAGGGPGSSTVEGSPGPSPAPSPAPAALNVEPEPVPVQFGDSDFGPAFSGGPAEFAPGPLIPVAPPLPALPEGAGPSAPAPLPGNGAGLSLSPLDLPPPAQPVVASPPAPRFSGPLFTDRPG